MRRPSAAVILVLSVFMAVPASAGQFEDATDAYRRGDYKTAHSLLKPLAEQGLPKSQYNLGLMYSLGQGVPQNLVLSHMWFTLAASRFPASEPGRRETAGKNRDLAASKMTPAQFAEAQRMAREWKPKSRR